MNLKTKNKNLNFDFNSLEGKVEKLTVKYEELFDEHVSVSKTKQNKNGSTVLPIEVEGQVVGYVVSSAKRSARVPFLRDVITALFEIECHRKKYDLLLKDEKKLKGATSFYSSFSLKVLDSLISNTFEVSAANTGSVLLYDSQNKDWEMKLSYGLSEEAKGKYSSSLQSNLAEHVLETGESLYLCEDVDVSLKDQLKRKDIACSLVVPISSGEKFYGVYCLTTYEESKKLSEKQVKVLSALGEYAGFILGLVG